MQWNLYPYYRNLCIEDTISGPKLYVAVLFHPCSNETLPTYLDIFCGHNFMCNPLYIRRLYQQRYNVDALYTIRSIQWIYVCNAHRAKILYTLYT